MTHVANIISQPDFSERPLPQHPPAVAARIDCKDAELRDLLEELVPRFNAAYEAFEGDLDTYLREYMVPEMGKNTQGLSERRPKDL